MPTRSRPAHAPGSSYCAYTPNGKKIVTVGSNSALRIFNHGLEDEPSTIDVMTDEHTAIAACSDFFVVGSTDGTVSKYSFATNSLDNVLIRSSLPIRDLALGKNNEWCAVASDELEVKIVNTMDMTKVKYLRDLTRPAKHVSFDPNGITLAVSSTDGIVYLYNLIEEEPLLVKRLDGLVQMLDSDAEASSKVYWHPNSDIFGAATASRDFQLVNRSSWQKQKAFTAGHRADITAAAWSPNGSLLVTADENNGLCLWEMQSQRMIKNFDDVQKTITAISWHPTENTLSYTDAYGELFIRDDFVPSTYANLLCKENDKPLPRLDAGLDDHLDDLLTPDVMSEDGDFIDDDDGAGYAEAFNVNGKRPAPALNGRPAKRYEGSSSWRPKIHEPIQPGSTPWNIDRRYLCLNLTGFIWTLDQESEYNTVTVEFSDRQAHRDFHFTDVYKYDKACLNDNGSLFSCAPSALTKNLAMIHYRPHETWTTRSDTRFYLPPGEEILCMSLGETSIAVATSSSYVRVYSLFGTPIKVYRYRNAPAVTCASFRDYVMTVGNGPVTSSGSTQLVYTIENIKRDEVCQLDDVLALPDGVSLRSVFFSDRGDPCIYDTEGVLLVLLHWRTPGQARWVPLLDTKTLDRLASGRKEETYFPIAVAQEKFYCIILKGGQQYPSFPRPISTSLDLKIPIYGAKPEDDDEEEVTGNFKLEEQFVRTNIHLSLLADMLENTNATSSQKAELPALERELDKLLLQLMANECREGEENGMKALELATMMRDRSGKMLEAAGKVAARFERDVLAEKIRDLAEGRLVGLVDEDDVGIL
ncbi:WD40 repeat-like protein [Piedraia hortae CBS 480.64]|uniref:WD40 repeat-like protein n=1 Tax=Piedraia hortae CBS 480.64 TaxID=1314780 RepID=A0A6A7BTV0_9PEZI|nr:WD40 repeat-like protein [Piedraia hortae CBS 480.64]